jgi:hypothetical protein
MVPSLRSIVLALVALTALLGCGRPKAPERPDDGDAGELTCDEKARAEVLCRDAFRQRCDSQERDCESTCSHGELPVSAEEVTTNRNLVEPEQCRENCSHGHDGCVAAIVPRCPLHCQ